jgi:NAD+-dependent protein deacetylase SIR2
MNVKALNVSLCLHSRWSLLTMADDFNQNKKMHSDHCKLIASLAKKAFLAEPTHFHNLLRLLDRRNKIKRIYTQNIDGLESKAGFDLDTTVPSMRCIPLHGTLFQLRCSICSTRRPLENYFHDLERGELPRCGSCEADRVERASNEKRSRSSGFLRADVVLYDEAIEDDEFIMDAGLADVQNVSEGDVLLVVGTSLKIPGINSIMKLIGPAFDKANGHIIYLDLKAPPTTWSKRFSMCIEGDCQVFAEAAINILKSTENLDNATGRQVEERRDMRPLWDWM